MRKSIFLALLTIGISISAVSQKTVIGIVKYSYDIVGEGIEELENVMPNAMTIIYGKTGVSTKLTGGMMGSMMGNIIMNDETQEAFMLDDKKEIVYLMDPEEMAQGMAEAEKPEPLMHEDTQEILGYLCTKYTQAVVSQGMEMEQILWVTSDLVAQEYTNKSFGEMAGQDMLNYQINGFPLKVEIDIPGMDAAIVLTVTSIDFKRIPKKTFKMPKNYEVKPFTQFGM